MSPRKGRSEFLSDRLENQAAHAFDSANNLRQRYPDDPIRLGLANNFEKDAREWQRVAREGTDPEKEIACHKIDHGAPGDGVSSACFIPLPELPPC